MVTDDSPSRTTPAEDAVHGNLSRAIWRLAWPILVSQVLFMVPGLYDAYWLGRIGAGAQAAAGLATSVRVTMISVLMALSGAGGAVVARYVGAEDKRNANLATLSAVILMTISAGLLGMIGFVFAEPLMRLAGADPTVLPLAVRYARILFAGLIAMELVPSIGGMLNIAGAPQVRLTMTLWVTGTQLLAEPILVQRFGIDGAVAAVVGANTVGMVWGLGVLLSGRASLKIDLGDLRVDGQMMWRIIRVALPNVVKRGAPNLANSLLMRLIAGYGSGVLDAWVVNTRILAAMQVPGMAMSGVSGAMVGINLGAGQVRRAERAVARINRVAAAISAGLGLILTISAPWLLEQFNLAPDVVPVGVTMLRTLCIGYLLQTVTWVHDGAQAGAGDTLSPMLVNLVSLWLIQLPLVAIIAKVFNLGPAALWWALVVGWTVQAALMVRRFRAAAWQTRSLA